MLPPNCASESLLLRCDVHTGVLRFAFSFLPSNITYEAVSWWHLVSRKMKLLLSGISLSLLPALRYAHTGVLRFAFRFLPFQIALTKLFSCTLSDSVSRYIKIENNPVHTFKMAFRALIKSFCTARSTLQLVIFERRKLCFIGISPE